MALQNVTGNQNTAVGYQAGNTLTNADFNTFIGTNSGQFVSTGANNTLVGYGAGSTLTTGTNNTLVGNNTNVLSSVTSNFINIGNLIFGTNANGTLGAPAGNVGIGTSAPGAMLDVSGSIRGMSLQMMSTATPFTTCGIGGLMVKSNVDSRPMYCDGSLWRPLQTTPSAYGSSGMSTVDFSSTNRFTTSLSCQAFNLYNLKDGQTYHLLLYGVSNAAPCSFTIYSDAGVTQLTRHEQSAAMTAVASRKTMVTIVVIGTDAVVTFTPDLS